MKVRFDSTFEDFGDVNKRSVEKNISTYVWLGLMMLVLSAAVGGLVYFLSGDWLFTAIISTVSLISGGIAWRHSYELTISVFHLDKLSYLCNNFPQGEVSLLSVFDNMDSVVSRQWSVVSSIVSRVLPYFFRFRDFEASHCEGVVPMAEAKIAAWGASQRLFCPMRRDWVKSHKFTYCSS